MKKVVSLILALMMCLSLCACGETQKQYSLGESVTTDMFVFTPQFNGFSSEAESGKVWMYVSGTVEHIGNSKGKESVEFTASANFDNGYIYNASQGFGGHKHKGSKHPYPTWNYGNAFSVDPLIDKTHIISMEIRVPEQVKTNTDKSLLVTFSINGKDYTYRIR